MSAQPPNIGGGGVTESPVLTDRTRKLLQPLLHVVLDVDGTLALDDNLFPSTIRFLVMCTGKSGHEILLNGESKHGKKTL